jgi:CubicO group peptidase (beta-lactamase class C family)
VAARVDDGDDPVAALIQRGLDGGIGSAMQLAAGEGGHVRRRGAWGCTARVPAPGAPVDETTPFDVASLSKIVATTAVTLRLCERGALALDAPVAAWLPELVDLATDATDAAGKRALTVRHLLAHSGGLHWWKPFYEALPPLAPRPAGAADARDGLVHLAAAVPLDAPPGARAVYSDLSFILLAAVCERVTGARLDTLATAQVWQPLGMAATRFVDLARGERLAGAVATEVCPRRGLVVGEVHDDNAHAAGGVAGHAGVFSTASDLGRFAAAWCASWRGERAPGGFDPGLVREFSRRTDVPGSTRCLGWDSPSEGAGASQAGDRWPRADAVGHGGFTGTSMWLDLPRARWVVLLTNRVHPSRSDERIKQLRPRIHDELHLALGW